MRNTSQQQQLQKKPNQTKPNKKKAKKKQTNKKKKNPNKKQTKTKTKEKVGIKNSSWVPNINVMSAVSSYFHGCVHFRCSRGSVILQVFANFF